MEEIIEKIFAAQDTVKMEFTLTEEGERKVQSYVDELKAKRKEILDVGLDTANETNLPEIADIEADVNFTGIDGDGEYYNSWGVTDNYDADAPIVLVYGKDFVAAGFQKGGV